MQYPTDSRETEAVRRVKQALETYGPFVSLSDAARETGVSLATLADAVRHKRIPALQVQRRRWLVRVSAVSAYFQKLDELEDAGRLQDKLVKDGLLTDVRLHADRRFSRVKAVRYRGSKPLSEVLVEERR